MPAINNIEGYLEQLEKFGPSVKKLKDIPNEAYKLDVLDISDTVEVDSKPVQFTGSLNCGPKLFVYNDPDDYHREDREGESDIVSGEPAEGEVLIGPNYDSQAVVNYGLDVFLKAGIALDKIGFSFSGKAQLKINTYKIHSNDKTLFDSVASDLGNFAWIFSLDGLKKMKENEACTLSFAGELSSSLELCWSDLYGGSLLGVSKLLQFASPLAVEVDAGASVQFDFGIKDDFLLVIKKVAGSKYEVGIKKNKRQSLAAGASIGVSASLSADSLEKVDLVIDDLLEQILKKGKKEITDILDKTTIDELAQEHLDIINVIAKVLNIPSPENKLEEVKIKWDEFLTTIKKGIVTYAKAKVEAGVRFEYGQVKTENSLLVAELSERALEKYHSDLIKFKIQGILQEDSSQLRIKKFLQEKGFKRTTGFGFDLKIADTGLSLDKETTVELTERTNEKGFLHVVSNSLKSYKGEFFGESFGWTAGLQAETDGFVSDPKMKDINCSLHLSFEWEEDRKLERNEIKKIADLAVVWELIPQHKVEDVRELLIAKLKTKKAKDIVISVKNHIPQDLFKAIVTSMCKIQQQNINTYYSILAKALAASMTASNETVEERIEKHGNYFLMHLKGENRDHPTIKEYSRYINESQISELAKAIDIIVNKGDESYSSDLLKGVIKGFNKFHNSIYRVKVLGYLMQYFAHIIGRSDDMDPVFQIAYKKGEKHSVMNIIKQ
ncbi:MAG: hypothetical protein JEZ14_22570, partial [Marinilabiliaceae bacterium]|nr:hypothetical protein [Marinilabiliaceae bacterium]